MIKIALCDDIPSHAKTAAKLVELYQKGRAGIKIKLDVFESGNRLLESVIKNGKYDIYLLDVVMPPPDGMALARQIREFDKDARVVFISHSENFAMDAFRNFAVQYILKPIDKDILFKVLDDIISKRNIKKDSFFTVSAPGRMVTLLYSSIVVIEKTGRIMRFHLDNGEFVDSKAVRTPFDLALENLLADNRFLRVHQSFAINLDYVRELRSTMFIMSNGMEITIPRPKFTTIKKSYLKFLSNSNSKN